MAYDAFISYSHAADDRLAPALQSALQRFAKPWHHRRALRVFRDQSSLAATPELWPTIQQALDDSSHFLLLASPEAAASRWVRREVAYWLEHQPRDRLLIVLTGGDLVWDEAANDFDWERTTALPPEVMGAFPSEPLWVDLRWAKGEEQLSLKHPDFLAAVGDLAAPLHGRAKEDLLGEDVRQHRRALRMAASAVTALVLLLLAALLGAGIAVQQRGRAEARTQEAVAARGTAEAARVEAEAARIEAETQQRIAQSRQLAAQALNERTGGIDRRLLLAVEAVRLNPDGVDARGSLLTLLETNPRLRKVLPVVENRYIFALGFAGDDRNLAVATTDGRIALWDTVEGEPRGVHFATKRKRSYLWADVNAEGTRLAAVRWTAGRQLIDIYALPDFSPVQELAAPLIDTTDLDKLVIIHGLAFSPDGRFLAAARGYGNTVLGVEGGGDIVFFDLERGEQLGEPILAHNTAVRSIAFSPDSAILASGGHEGGVQLWDVATRQPIGSALETGYPLIHALAFSPDGSYLAATGSGGVDIWDMSAEGPENARRGIQPDNEIFALAFSPDSKTLVTGAADGSLRIWDPAVAEPEAEIVAGHDALVYRLAFAPDGRVLASGDSDGTVMVWDLDRDSRLGSAIPGAVRGISPSGALLVVDEGEQLAVLAAEDGRRLGVLDVSPTVLDYSVEHPAYTRVNFSPDDSTIAVIPMTGPISLWRPTGERLGELSLGEKDDFSAIALSRDGAVLATGDREGTVMLWEGSTLAPIGSPLDAHPNYVTGLVFSADGLALASTSWDGVLKVWDPETGALLRESAGMGPMAALAFTPDDRAIVGVSVEGGLYEWDRESLAPRGETLYDDGSYLWQIAFSPDGRDLATAGFAGRIVLWDAAARAAIGEPLVFAGGSVSELAFDRRGDSLLSANIDGDGMIWNVSVKGWIDLACATANRNLTGAEWAQYLGNEPYQKTCPDLPAPTEPDPVAA